MIPRPSIVVADELDDRLVILTFDQPNDFKWRWERFYMRGAVCWPILLPAREGAVQGCLLMAGRHVSSGVTYLFEERVFASIGHVLGEGGRVEYPGIAPAFSEWWVRYFCSVYWYHHPIETHAAYRRQVSDSDLVSPKPEFVPLDWDDPEDVIAHVYAAGVSGVLKFNKGGLCDEALRLYSLSDGAAVGPVMRAMMAAVYGMIRYPVRMGE